MELVNKTIMKNTLLILCFLFSLKSMACGCLNSSTIDAKYLRSEVVAKVKILKIYKNVDNYLYYKADVLVEKIYKGNDLELKSIYIYGDNDGELIGRMGTSCDIFIPLGAELLIYTSKNERGEYTLNQCSGHLDLYTTQKWQKERNKLELKVIKKLKRKKIKLIYNKGKEVFPSHLYDSLQVFNNIKLRKRYAIFEIDYKSYGSEKLEVELEDIKVICGFNKKLDAQLIEIFKKVVWRSKIKEGQSSKRLLIIKYKKATEKEPSHLIHDF
ncbi:MAG: hypothetical protein COA67_11835 [Lutibacter sp.]|nr:MAG: hypothetical protein COA67_11835 [Lutibacter sp.]